MANQRSQFVSSSWIGHVSYREDESRLKIRFRGDHEPTYYHEFPYESYHAFREADSHGAWFNRNVRHVWTDERESGHYWPGQ